MNCQQRVRGFAASVLRTVDRFKYKPIPRHQNRDQSSLFTQTLSLLVMALMIFYVYQTVTSFLHQVPVTSLEQLDLLPGFDVSLNKSKFGNDITLPFGFNLRGERLNEILYNESLFTFHFTQRSVFCAVTCQSPFSSAIDHQSRRRTARNSRARDGAV